MKTTFDLRMFGDEQAVTVIVSQKIAGKYAYKIIMLTFIYHIFLEIVTYLVEQKMRERENDQPHFSQSHYIAHISAPAFGPLFSFSIWTKIAYLHRFAQLYCDKRV